VFSVIKQDSSASHPLNAASSRISTDAAIEVLLNEAQLVSAD
jgi:hypothetical protein